MSAFILNATIEAANQNATASTMFLEEALEALKSGGNESDVGWRIRAAIDILGLQTRHFKDTQLRFCGEG